MSGRLLELIATLNSYPRETTIMAMVLWYQGKMMLSLTSVSSKTKCGYIDLGPQTGKRPSFNPIWTRDKWMLGLATRGNAFLLNRQGTMPIS